MVRVKICALTREQDIELALDLGADALGFVVEPTSKRALEPSRAVELAKFVAGRALTVAVFGRPFRFEGDHAFDLHQFRWEPTDGPALENQRLALTANLAEQLSADTEFILEPHVAGQFGGTGQLADWDVAAELVARGFSKMHLAGGLAPDNVAGAIALVSPFGVDVASGTEAVPGVKDPVRMRDFFAAIRG